ncbi:SigE family RNA polymerase sigma factor [Nocardioides alpinus]|uniref:SigE family RNA polymerase sigma factor n=1 Tax=Nocardioides alpinus TaxID=748909 RepID=A0ABX4R2U8_9ACTN|nr:SigE family RNA polymerase sigma factor [Nocardioides alpinus]
MRVVGGTDLDFASYVAARRPALLRWAWSVAGDPHTAEDLLQASLVRVLARWDTLRDRGAADAYVRRTITRQHISWHRQSWRHREVSTASPPERAVVTPGRADAVGLWSLVQGLPPQQRDTVALRYYEELSIAETAAVLGCSTGTVKSNTSRAITTLRRLAVDTALAG